MRNVKKFLARATVFFLVSGVFNSSLNAEEYWTSTGGCGYEDSISAPSLMPYIALGTVLTGAIVAIAVRHKGHHNHSHSHSH